MRILKENAQYTSRKKAVDYLEKSNFFDNFNNRSEFGETIEPSESSKKQAIDYYIRIYLRNKITSLRGDKGGKYIFGCVRIIHEEGLSPKEYTKLNEIVRVIVKDEELYKSLDYNFNGLEFDELYDKIQGYIATFGEKNLEVGKDKSHSNKLYKIVRIDTFEESSKYEEYNDWCLCQYDNMFNDYSDYGSKTIYFVLHNDFEKFPSDTEEWMDEHEDCDYNDDYGLSMICVIVDEDGNLTDSVTRYNHNLTPASGDVQMAFTEEEIGEIVGGEFRNIFVPSPNERNYMSVYGDLLDSVQMWLTEAHFDGEKDDYTLRYEELEFDGTKFELSCVQYRCDSETGKNAIYCISADLDGGDVTILYDYDNGRFLCPWSIYVNLVNDTLIYQNTKGTYIKSLSRNENIFKRPVNSTYFCENTLIATNHNHKEILINTLDSSIVENNMNCYSYRIINPYIILGYNGDKWEHYKFNVYDAKNNKFVNDKPLYSISSNFSIDNIATFGDNYIHCNSVRYLVCSHNKDYTNPFLFHITNGEEIDLNIPHFTELRNKSIFHRYGIICDEKNDKSYVLDIYEKKIILEKKGSCYIEMEDTGIGGFILRTYHNHKNRYSIYKKGEIIVDNLQEYTLVDTYHVKLKNEDGKYGMFWLKKYQMSYFPEFEKEWFDDLRVMHRSYIVVDGKKEKEVYLS